MVNRTDRTAARKLDKQADKTVLENASTARPSRKSSKDKYAGDDLIITLSNAYENKRAQQVFEWECIQPGNVQRTA